MGGGQHGSSLVENKGLSGCPVRVQGTESLDMRCAEADLILRDHPVAKALEEIGSNLMGASTTGPHVLVALLEDTEESPAVQCRWTDAQVVGESLNLASDGEFGSTQELFELDVQLGSASEARGRASVMGGRGRGSSSRWSGGLASLS